MSIAVNSAGTRADFYINKANVGNVTTNLITTPAGLAGEYRIVKSGGGTASRAIRTDWFRLIKVVG
jgi:hypothetical protein